MQSHTDAFSEVLKGANGKVVQRATQYRSHFGAYAISSIALVEIVKGFHKANVKTGCSYSCKDCRAFPDRKIP